MYFLCINIMFFHKSFETFLNALLRMKSNDMRQIIGANDPVDKN